MGVETVIMSIFGISLSIGGLAFFLISSLIIKRILELFPNAKMTRDWKILFVLVLFFSFGYVINIVLLIMQIVGFDVSLIIPIMTAFVYLFGGLFVFLIVRLSYRTYKVILEAAEEGE